MVERLTEIQQEFADEWGCLVTLSWNGLHLAISPQKPDKNQLTLDGMEMPRFTEFTGEGE